MYCQQETNEYESKEMEQEQIRNLFLYKPLEQQPYRKFLKISTYFHESFFEKENGFTFITKNGKPKKGFYMPDLCEPHFPCKREFSLREFEDGYLILYPETGIVGFFLVTVQNNIHYCGFCPCFEGKRSFYPSKFEDNPDLIKTWWHSLDVFINILCGHFLFENK